jgi:hypothetical protein
MSVVAVIIWFSAAVGGLPLLAARLIEYTSDFQGAATDLPVSAISARARTTTYGSGRPAWLGAMT